MLALIPLNISIRLRDNAGVVEKNAVSELRQLFKDKTGIDPSGKRFEILIGVLDYNGKLGNIRVDNVKSLKKLPNNQQAYIIQPKGRNKLLITGLNEKGVYYGARTLYQLLEPVISIYSLSHSSGLVRYRRKRIMGFSTEVDTIVSFNKA